MVCGDQLRNAIRQHLGQLEGYDAPFENKMGILSVEMRLRKFNTLESLADLVINRRLTLERVVQELNEKLFSKHASWLYITCVLALFPAFLECACKKIKTFGINDYFRSWSGRKCCVEIERHAVEVWKPWIENKSCGMAYLEKNVTGFPHKAEQRMLKRFYKIIQKME